MPAVKTEAGLEPQSHRLLPILLLVVLPFCYGAATRIPFTFVAVHALDHLHCSLPTVALLLGAYQISRVLSNCLVGVLGSRTSLLLGAASGLLGYTLLAASAVSRYAPSSSDSRCYSGTGSWAVEVWSLALPLVLVGFSEQIVPLQDFCKATYWRCNATLRQKLLLLYASNVCGTSVGFLLSGITHHIWGLAGPSALGMLLEALLLLGSAIYCSTAQLTADSATPAHASSMQRLASDAGWLEECQLAARTPSLLERAASGAVAACLVAELTLAGSQQLHPGQDNSPAGSEQREQVPSVTQHAGRSAASLRRRLPEKQARRPLPHPAIKEQCQQQAEDSIEPARSPFSGLSKQFSGSTAADYEGDSGLIRPPWIAYVIAAAFCNQALLIGVSLSTAPLYMALTLKLQVLHVGLAFGVGEALGSAALLYTSSPIGQARLRKWLPMPLSMLAILTTMGVASVLLPLLPGKAAFVVCLMAIMGLNDVGTSMCAEVQGATLPGRHYRQMNALGNVLRRTGNTCTCILGPLLFQLSGGAPFVLFGVLTLAWVVLLSALFGVRASELHYLAPTAVPPADACKADEHSNGGDVHADDSSKLSSMVPRPWRDLRRYAGLSFVSMERKFWDQQVVGSQPRGST